VVSRAPDMSRVKPSAGQRAQRERFRQAVQYGKKALAEPEGRLFYQAAAKARQTSLYGAVITDYFHGPVVERVESGGYQGRVGDEIQVWATDNVGVAAVTIEFIDETGQVFEQGEAQETPTTGGCWVYVTHRTAAPDSLVRIRVTVHDRPGNEAAWEDMVMIAATSDPPPMRANEAEVLSVPLMVKMVEWGECNGGPGVNDFPADRFNLICPARPP